MCHVIPLKLQPNLTLLAKVLKVAFINRPQQLVTLKYEQKVHPLSIDLVASSDNNLTICLDYAIIGGYFVTLMQ